MCVRLITHFTYMPKFHSKLKITKIEFGEKFMNSRI